MEEKRKIKFGDIVVYINTCIFFIWACLSFFGSVSKIQIFESSFGLSFYFSFLAFPVFYISYFFVLKKRYKLNYVIFPFIIIVACLSLSSLGMSYLLYVKYDGFFSTTPLSVWVKELIKYVYDVAGIIYASFFLATLNKKVFLKVGTVFFWVWFFVGIFEIVVFFLNNQTINAIYDKINFLNIFETTEVMERIRSNYGGFRFYGFGNEPASNCLLICCFIVPILIYRFKDFKDGKLSVFQTIRYFLAIFITLVFAYLTKSSSVLAGFLVMGVFATVLLMRNERIKVVWKIIIMAGIVTIIVIIFAVPQLFNVLTSSFSKIFDPNDYSTQHRYSTIWNDLNILIRFPLFGCGDGLQGYYYYKNVVGTWMAGNVETQEAILGHYGLLGGGATIPAILSGFGIFGVVVLVFSLRRFIISSSLMVRKFDKRLKTIILMDLVIVFVLLCATATIHWNASIYILLASPMLFRSEYKYDNNISISYLEVRI